MKSVTALILIIITSSLCFSQTDEATRVKHFNLKSKLALQGYDPVSYFDGKPLEGDKSLTSMYNGVTYRFATERNKKRFDGSPASYEPNYGGWCSFAMGDYGEKVKVDPKTYKIIDGELYLFYNFFFNNTLDDWNKNEPNLMKQGDVNWEKIIGAK